jgi:hypothetical protein
VAAGEGRKSESVQKQTRKKKFRIIQDHSGSGSRFSEQVGGKMTCAWHRMQRQVGVKGPGIILK